MYFNNKSIKATKFNTVTNYEKASVLIEKKRCIIKFWFLYKKRKVFNNEGIWINTKPLLYKNITSKNK